MSDTTKRVMSDLAIAGGPPAFSESLHVGRPNIGDRERLMARIGDALDRRWLTNAGPFVQEFEARVADMAGVNHCIAVCNGTVALEIAIRALELTGEVIVPSFTFIATAHALRWQGITPVFADIDPATHLIDPASVRRLITPKTSGVIGVHLWGRCCDVAGLERVTRPAGLRLMFDAAHAFGCGDSTGRVGGFGDLEVFSFHATKFVNALEGGAVVTNSDELARKMRLMKNFGFLGYDNVGYIGTNGKMNEFSAAMGLTSLESMDDFIACNRAHHAAYVRELKGLAGVRVIEYEAGLAQNFQYVVAEVDAETCPIARDVLLDVLWAEQIRARRYFYPGCHRMEPYASEASVSGRRLPATERLAKRILVLPTGTAMTTADVATVASVIRVAVASGEDLMARFGRAADAVHHDVFA